MKFDFSYMSRRRAIRDAQENDECVYEVRLEGPKRGEGQTYLARRSWPNPDPQVRGDGGHWRYVVLPKRHG
jgi:hypothetical protein